MLGLAAALFAFGPDSRVNRVFALFLVLRGMSMGLGSLRELARDVGDLGLVAYFGALYPYFVIPVPFVLAWFVSVYPAPRGPLGRGRAGPLALLAAVLVLEALYVADHRLWGVPNLTLDDGSPVQAEGPMFPLGALMFFAFAPVAWLLFRDYRRAPPGPFRNSTLLVGMGFALNVVFEGTGGAIAALNLAFSPSFAALLQVPAVLIVAAGLAQLARHARDSGDEAVRGAVRRALLAAVLPAVSYIVLPFGHPLYTLVLGLWRLALPVLVCYALVRYRLFDIDVKVRWTVRQSTLAAVFIGLFFVVSESAQTFFTTSTDLGPYLGIVAAGLLVFAIAPLQKAADRLAHLTVPASKPSAQLTAAERLEIYREQVRFAWSDGTLDRGERLFLERMRQRLGLSPDEASSIELEAARETPGPA